MKKRIVESSLEEMEVKGQHGEHIRRLDELIPLMNCDSKEVRDEACMATCFILKYVMEYMEEITTVRIKAEDIFGLKCMLKSKLPNLKQKDGDGHTVDLFRQQFKVLLDKVIRDYNRKIRNKVKRYGYPMITKPKGWNEMKERPKTAFFFYENSQGRKGKFIGMVSL